ncbi:G-protein coupled receptor Mth-like 1-like 4 [Homarus americanus]|uniref:G-protein coupled receptor Mth-like 1-like 4 n=1 Tax=Homarus americanus TaxID=6706 RepID=A0A8J5JAF0_HOMAM|nr:G-protein coupled receptor Mth-like 1-like 4 [Homarus americanus]
MTVKVVLTVVVVTLVLTTASGVGAKDFVEYEYTPLLYNYSTKRTNKHIASADSVVYNSLLYNATLQKCWCLGDQVWDGSQCTDTTTSVVVQDLEAGGVVVVKTNEFGSVKVGEPQCPPGHSFVVLDSTRESLDQFSLLDSGNLYWQQHQYHQYCIEHTLHEGGEPNSWEAHVCLSPPKVPRCCARGLSLGADNFCTATTNHVFTPPVMVDGVLIKWLVEGDGDINNVTCEDFEELMILQLNTDGSYLTYSSGEASLVWSPPNSQGSEQRQDYCVGVEAGKDDYFVRLCYEDLVASHHQQCRDATCVRKCCPENELIDGVNCVPATSDNELWKPSFYNPDNLTLNVPPAADLRVVHGFPLCGNFFQTGVDDPEEEIFLLSNGFLKFSGFPKPYPPDRYCVEKFLGVDGSASTYGLICFEDNVEELMTCRTIARKYVYPSFTLVSCVFLLVTLVSYASVPELRKKLHSKCLMSLVSALFLAYILMPIVYLADGNMHPSVCTTIATVLLWSFLAAFFWLNVMCFDIWRTLKAMRTVTEGGEWARRRFRMYSLYAWGSSFLLALLALIMETLPDTHSVIRPNFSGTCWFKNYHNASMWLYFYGWVLALTVANALFFIGVAFILIRSQNDPILQRTREQNRERILTDIINALQGVTIFLVFVCKKNTLKKIKEQWCRMVRREQHSPGSVMSTSRPTMSTTSGKRTSDVSSLRPSEQLCAVKVDAKNYTEDIIAMDTVVRTNGSQSVPPSPQENHSTPSSPQEHLPTPPNPKEHHPAPPSPQEHTDSLAERERDRSSIDTYDETDPMIPPAFVGDGQASEERDQPEDLTPTEATPLRSTVPPSETPETHF